MTRINANVRIQELTDSHLEAEHREIKRMGSSYRIRKKRPQTICQRHMQEFKLSSGHVIFFLDKGLFTLNRYLQIHQECKNRGTNVTDFSPAWSIYDQEHMLDYYQFTELDNDIIRRRIAERLVLSEQVPRFYKKPISKHQAISLLQFDIRHNREYAFEILEQHLQGSKPNIVEIDSASQFKTMYPHVLR